MSKTNLTEKDFKVGMKVVPHDKTAGVRNLNNCSHWTQFGGKKQGFLYVSSILENGLSLSSKKNSESGALFSFSDVTIYEEKPKKLKKKDIYVLIEDQPNCDKALEILTKYKEPLSKIPSGFVYNSTYEYLKLSSSGKWFIGYDCPNLTEITLDELEQLLNKPKIKKSELLERIEALEKKLESKYEDKTEIKEDKPNEITYWKDNPPKFEIGKIYKFKDCIFYCNRIDGDQLFGFGFTGVKWHESERFSSTRNQLNFIEATDEEWLRRLKEEAYRKGFKVGVVFDSPNPKYDFALNQKIINENFEWFEWEKGKRVLMCSTDKNEGGGTIMFEGKWAEIIQEPQFEAGQTGLFWNGDFEVAIENSMVYFGKIDHITENSYFKRKHFTWLFENFKPINLD